MKNMKFLIGSDPEIFIMDKNNNISSSIGIFKGTKDKPIDIGEGCAVQEDNILVEFNIPPVDNVDDFIKYINYSKNYIETILAPLGKKLHYSSSEMVTDEVLKDPKSKVFGCSPSFNVLTETISEIDLNILTEKQSKIRSSGFHIHLGYENPTEEMNDRLVMCFEIFTTLSLLSKDNDKYNRRSIYGLIGDCRNKHYGVECRSLGGFFLKDDETLKLVWNQIQKSIDFALNSTLTNEDLRGMLLFCIDQKDNSIDLEKVDLLLNHLEIEKVNI